MVMIMTMNVRLVTLDVKTVTLGHQIVIVAKMAISSKMEMYVKINVIIWMNIPILIPMNVNLVTPLAPNVPQGLKFAKTVTLTMDFILIGITTSACEQVIVLKVLMQMLMVFVKLVTLIV